MAIVYASEAVVEFVSDFKVLGYHQTGANWHRWVLNSGHGARCCAEWGAVTPHGVRQQSSRS